MLYYEQLFTKAKCVNCQSEIPGLGVECSECEGNLRFCCDCVAVGCELGQHKRDHRYRFFDSGSLSLFPASANEISSAKENNVSATNSSPRWSAREEIRLLDAIEQYGFGNWQDISKHVESRGANEAKDEFVKRYVSGHIGHVSWAGRNNYSDQGADYEFKRSSTVFPQPIDHTIPIDDGPLSPSLTQRLPPLSISSDEMLQLGYMPFRDDYEKEYDNDAEKLVSQLTFGPEDDEIDIGLKLSLVDMYTRRLRERSRRKRVIRDYQLVSKFFKKDRSTKPSVPNSGDDDSTKDASKRFQGYEKQLREKLQPFAQFYNSREFEAMIRNLVKEKDLTFRLQELFKYRSAGITKAEECVEFERTRAASLLRGKRGAEVLLGSVEEEEGDEDRSYKRAMIQSPALIQQLLLTTPADSVSLRMAMGNEENVSENGSAIQNLTPQQFCKDDYNLKSLESNESDLALLPRILAGDLEAQIQPQQVLQESLYPPNEKQKDSVALYTVNCIPGSDSLRKEELNLCKSTSILPCQYLTYKLGYFLQTLPKMETNNEQSVLPPDIDQKDWKKLTNNFDSGKNSALLESNYW